MISTDYLESSMLDQLLSEVHSGDTINIGLLKSDYRELNSGTSNHELVWPFYMISSKENEYMNLYIVNSAKSSSGSTTIMGCGLLLICILAGLAQVAKK